MKEKVVFCFCRIPRMTMLYRGEWSGSSTILSGISARRAAVNECVGRAGLAADWAAHRGEKASAFFAKTRVLRDFRAAVFAKEFRLLFVHHSVPKLFT